MKRHRIGLYAGLLSLAAAAFAQDLPPLPSGTVKALDSILGPEAYAHVKTMAGPAFAGRLTGHEGYTAACEWAARLFHRWGLRPLGDRGGYLQSFPAPCTVVRRAEMTLFLPGETDGRALAANKDFLPLLYSDSGKAEAGLVFAGWGISAPELGYDDYAGLDAAGKFVLCFRGRPAIDDPRIGPHDEHRVRMATARGKGALGVFYIYPEPISNPNGDWQKGFLPAIISEKTADLILKELSSNCVDLKKALRTYKRPISFPLRARVRYAVESEHRPEALGYNVVGVIEGSDPALRGEAVVFGGHFDHTGRHLGLLFPGADDNASGSATVLEIAEAFSKLDRRPRRSVVFALFGGEETGLLGSTHFVAHLPAPLAKIEAMFNFDMTGEGDGAWAGASTDALKAALAAADRRVGILRGVGGLGGGGSDFAPFLEKGVPSVSIGSNGPHLAYHAVGDTVFRINPDIMAEIAKVAFLAGLETADRRPR